MRTTRQPQINTFCKNFDCTNPVKIRASVIKNQVNVFCSIGCRGAYKTATFKEAFWLRVRRDLNLGPNGDCWAFITYNGTFLKKTTYKKKSYTVYRLAYLFHHNFPPLADDVVIRHSCDVRECVNPAHLSTGSQQENMDDMVERGRSATGTKNGGAKLSETQVRNIRKKYNPDIGMGIVPLAKQYKVSNATIWRIVSGTHWKETK